MAVYADLGIDLPLGATGECRTTCPRCSASRRKQRDRCLAVNASEGVWHCWHCGWRGSLKRTDGQRPFIPMMHQPPRTPDARRQDAIERRWQEAAPLTVGDPAFVYLWSRGLVLPLRDMPPHLRYHARLPYRHDDGTLTYHPAMLARVDNPEAAVVTLHRTYLRNDGSKAHVPTVKKLMPCALGGASAGGAIRLYPAGETLAVTEGIETALAVRLFTGLPVWAAISATGMEQVILPDHVETVMICGDHDDPGIRAAQALAQRLIAQGRIVTIRVPRRPRTDWADETSCANAFCNMALEIKPREPAAEDHPLDSGALPKQRPSVRTAVQAALATHVTARVRRTL